MQESESPWRAEHFHHIVTALREAASPVATAEAREMHTCQLGTGLEQTNFPT